MNEYWPDVVFLRILDELIDLILVQGPVLPCPWVAREDLYRSTLPFSRPGDNLPETTGYRYVEAEPHSNKDDYPASWARILVLQDGTLMDKRLSRFFITEQIKENRGSVRRTDMVQAICSQEISPVDSEFTS